MTNTIDELNELLKEALALGQRMDRFKEGEAVLVCHTTGGQEFVLRQQVNEHDNRGNSKKPHQNVGDQLGAIKKNNWFRTA